MARSDSDVQGTYGDVRHVPCADSPNGARPGRALERFLRPSLSRPLGLRARVDKARARTSENEIAGKSAHGYLAETIALCRRLKRQFSHFKDEFRQFVHDSPRYAGTGSVGEIVPPIAGTSLRTNVGSPSLVGYLFVADAWHSLVSRFLTKNSNVLDIGCGCGKTARTLIYHPYIKHYLGFDVIRENVDWCNRTIAPLTHDRFQFHFLDVYSRAYNPVGKLIGADVDFPSVGGTIDFAFAASVFTHLLEEDAKHYLREISRVLAPDGLFLPSIHTNPSPGTVYSGNECRIDIDSDYFIHLAEAAGLRLLNRLGSVCGQEVFLFTACSNTRPPAD